MNINFKKVALIGVPIVVLGGLILWSKKASAAPGAGGGIFGIGDLGSGSSGSGSGGGASAPAANPFPLQVGSTGAKVKELQKAVNATQDGVFGPLTQKNLVALYCMYSVPDQATLNYIESFKGLPADCVQPGGGAGTPTDAFSPTYDPNTGLTTFPEL